jgi:hypothetical protein
VRATSRDSACRFTSSSTTTTRPWTTWGASKHGRFGHRFRVCREVCPSRSATVFSAFAFRIPMRIWLNGGREMGREGFEPSTLGFIREKSNQ